MTDLGVAACNEAMRKVKGGINGDIERSISRKTGS